MNQIDKPLDDINFLEIKKKEILDKISALILIKKQSQNSLASKGSNKLISMTIKLSTSWDDKDIGSLLTMWIEKPGAIRIADCIVANIWLSQYSASNFSFNIFGDMSIKETFGARLYVKIDRTDGRKDSWCYTPSLTLEYNDGYKMIKEFTVSLIDQSQQNIFVL